MKLFRYVMPIIAFCGMITAVMPVDGAEIEERDIEAVRQFVKTKRAIYVADKGGQLALSGEVRFEYQHVREKINGKKQRGSGHYDSCGEHRECMRYGTNKYDVEFNLRLDYTGECTWAAVAVEFDNPAGIKGQCSGNYCPKDYGCSDECGSGVCNKVCLERAFMGYKIFDCGDQRLDVELGRRYLYNVFDSRIQFGNRFDGVTFTYTNSFEDITDFYSKSAMFIIDAVVDNYGWASEFGFLDILACGLDLKYSYIDWTRGTDRCGEHYYDSTCVRNWAFRNSQFTAIYHFNAGWLCTDAKIYGAYEINHAAKRREATDYKKANHAWYVGIQFGKVKHAGDWSLDFMYQRVEAQAVSDRDVAGMGRGNVNGECLAAATDASDARGNANYKGFLIEGLYAITDNLTVDLEAEWTKDVTSKIGGDISYHKYEIEFIYAF